MKRITREDLYLEIATSIAKRSTCNRANVGAILVRDGQILGTGYNGAPSGLPHCLDTGCDMLDGHCVRTVHAEVNAVLSAAKNGVSTRGATVYSTHKPCFRCKQVLTNAGVTEVIWVKDYQDGRND